MELVTAAWRLNENIPGYLLSRIKSEIKDLHKKKVAILGLAFKKNIDDIRYSLSPKLQRYFLAEGAIVSVSDPFIDSQLLKDALKDADIVVIGVDHDSYRDLNFDYLKKLVAPNSLICDIWNIFATGKIVFYLKDMLNKQKKIDSTTWVNGENKKNKRNKQLAISKRVLIH